MIDDLTYFTFMQSYRPQHQLGVIGLWKGSISSGLGYLRSIRSDGFVVGCHPSSRGHPRKVDAGRPVLLHGGG
jgi:hypothetical protein